MASHIFGSQIDIHSGGIDLKFPHHENEEAQSCAFHDVLQWVNYWLHAGHLTLKGTKMSKSLKNTISIQEILMHHSPQEFRFFCLLTKYRNEMHYTPQAFNAANNVYESFRTFVTNCNAYIQGSSKWKSFDESALYAEIETSKEKIYEALCNDFDTPTTIHILQDLMKYTNKLIDQKEEEETLIGARSIAPISATNQYIQNTLKMFGVTLQPKIETVLETETGHDYRPDLSRILDSAIAFRAHVRLSALGKMPNKSNKQPATLLLLELCDSFRDQMKNLGILIQDHQMKSSWQVFNPKKKINENE